MALELIIYARVNVNISKLRELKQCYISDLFVTTYLAEDNGSFHTFLLKKLPVPDLSVLMLGVKKSLAGEVKWHKIKLHSTTNYY